MFYYSAFSKNRNIYINLPIILPIPLHIFRFNDTNCIFANYKTTRDYRTTFTQGILKFMQLSDVETTLPVVGR